MNPRNQTQAIPSPNVNQAITATLASNKVIRNTYLLLSMTLIFSAFTAAASVSYTHLTLPTSDLV